GAGDELRAGHLDRHVVRQFLLRGRGRRVQEQRDLGRIALRSGAAAGAGGRGGGPGGGGRRGRAPRRGGCGRRGRGRRAGGAALGEDGLRLRRPQPPPVVVLAARDLAGALKLLVG